ncbi:hypothetical protein NPIL_162711 [Nephila pilipes]|uniref:Uncharacterized protein n=1 Tax=Nephila pilipes TaxID=299642 RepID=A0A8X6TYU1_NEPPI|nr:hypothetical protein NPIL_162711 [Nephila pilipes]
MAADTLRMSLFHETPTQITTSLPSSSWVLTMLHLSHSISSNVPGKNWRCRVEIHQYSESQSTDFFYSSGSKHASKATMLTDI